MVDEKDRFGDKLKAKEKAEEDRFFKERDKVALERLRQERGTAGQQARSGAPVSCPKDGSPLASVEHLGVTVEECPKCNGMWVDKGQLQTLAARERDSWLGRFFYRPRL